MKKSETMKKIKSIVAIFIVGLFFGAQGLFAQGAATSPSDPPGSPHAGDVPIGGGAPIGGGLVILLSLGAGYGVKKVYNYYNEDNEELEE